jgi:hypothetical protein
MYIVDEHRMQILGKRPPSVREHGNVRKFQVRNNNYNYYYYYYYHHHHHHHLVRFHAVLLSIVPASLFVGAHTREDSEDGAHTCN